MRYAYGDDAEQWVQVLEPAEQSKGVAVVIHGGFWRSQYDASLGEPLAIDIANRGWTAVNVEYRRVGGGGGWPNTFSDVSDAIDFLADIGLNLSRVVVIGHSAGGHLATWAAGRSGLPAGTPGSTPRVHVTGVVSQAGVLDLLTAAKEGVGGTAVKDLLGGGSEDHPMRYRWASPMSQVPLSVPVICVHSREDESVPFGQSEIYVNEVAKLGGDAELVEVTGDHMSHVDTESSAWSAVCDALARF